MDHKCDGDQGVITYVELVIEDESGEKVKTSQLFLNSHLDGINLCITGACPEGTFRAEMRDEVWLWHKTSANLLDEAWNLLKNLILKVDFPLAVEYEFCAKLVSLRDNYDENNELLEEPPGIINDFVEVDVRTKSNLAITVGTFKLESMEEQDTNLFNWMGDLVQHNQVLTRQSNELEKQITNLRNEHEYVLKEYEVAKEHYELLTKDLLNKSTQLLNSKKDKIWELQRKLDEPRKRTKVERETDLELEANESSKIDSTFRLPDLNVSDLEIVRQYIVESEHGPEIPSDPDSSLDDGIKIESPELRVADSSDSSSENDFHGSPDSQALDDKIRPGAVEDNQAEIPTDYSSES